MRRYALVSGKAISQRYGLVKVLARLYPTESPFPLCPALSRGRKKNNHGAETCAICGGPKGNGGEICTYCSHEQERERKARKAELQAQHDAPFCRWGGEWTV